MQERQVKPDIGNGTLESDVKCGSGPPSVPHTAPLCPILLDSAGRKACSAGKVGASCSTAGTFSRMCGVGFTGTKTYTCTAANGTASYWNETSSTCVGVNYERLLPDFANVPRNELTSPKPFVAST